VSVTRWLFAAGGCVATTATLRSNRYQATVPSAWDVEDHADSDDARVVLRVPAVAVAGSGKTFELRIYAWDVRESPLSPIDQVVTRRVGEGNEAPMRSEGTADAEECFDVRQQHTVCRGQPREYARRQATTWVEVDTSAESSGPRRNPTPPAPKTEHARNQLGTKAADASAADAASSASGQNVGRGSQRGGPKAAWPTLDAARHATPNRPALSRAGHHPSHAGASVVSLAAGVWGAPPRHRAGVGRSFPRDPLLHPAGSRSLHRRG
jgi:hypothetical protein